MQADPRPCSVSHLAEAKKTPDPEVVRELETLLERARSGEVLGFIALCFLTESRSMHCDCGDTDFSAMLVAIESWKYQRLKDGDS